MGFKIFNWTSQWSGTKWQITIKDLYLWMGVWLRFYMCYMKINYHKNYSEAWLPYCFTVLNASPDKETQINSGIPMKTINATLN